MSACIGKSNNVTREEEKFFSSSTEHLYLFRILLERFGPQKANSGNKREYLFTVFDNPLLTPLSSRNWIHFLSTPQTHTQDKQVRTKKFPAKKPGYFFWKLAGLLCPFSYLHAQLGRISKLLLLLLLLAFSSLTSRGANRKLNNARCSSDNVWSSWIINKTFLSFSSLSLFSISSSVCRVVILLWPKAAMRKKLSRAGGRHRSSRPKLSQF